MCHPLRPVLKKNTKFVGTDEHEQHFKLIKKQKPQKQRKINL